MRCEQLCKDAEWFM
jgi:hypothetical protein